MNRMLTALPILLVSQSLGLAQGRSERVAPAPASEPVRSAPALPSRTTSSPERESPKSTSTAPAKGNAARVSAYEDGPTVKGYPKVSQPWTYTPGWWAPFKGRVATAGGSLEVNRLDADQVVDHAHNAIYARCYGIVVPPGGKLEARMEHARTSGMRILLVGYWGDDLQEGMASALQPQSMPYVKYENVSGEPRGIYLIAVDTEEHSDAKNPYTFKVTKSWKPEETPTSPNLLRTSIRVRP